MKESQRTNGAVGPRWESLSPLRPHNLRPRVEHSAFQKFPFHFTTPFDCMTCPIQRWKGERLVSLPDRVSAVGDPYGSLTYTEVHFRSRPNSEVPTLGVHTVILNCYSCGVPH
jgi:hypothetical protein